MAKYVGVPQAFIITASSNLLRLQIRNKIKKLRADDELIQREGFESLSLEELQTALAARGMRADSDDILLLRKRLSEWIDLSLNHNLSEAFLILSRTFLISEPYSPTENTSSSTTEKVSATVDSPLVEPKTQPIPAKTTSNTKQPTPSETEAAAVKIILETSAAEELKVELEQLKKSLKASESSTSSNIPSATIITTSNPSPSPMKPLHEFPQVVTISNEPLSKSIEVDESDVKTPIPTKEKAQISEVDTNIKRIQGKLEKMLKDLEKEIVQVKEASSEITSSPKSSGQGTSVLTLQQLLDTLQSINTPKEVCDEIISKIDSDKVKIFGCFV